MLGCPPYILSTFYTFRNIIQTIQRPDTATIDQNPSFTNGGSSQSQGSEAADFPEPNLEIFSFCSFGTQKPIYSGRMVLIVSQIVQNSFPTDSEIFSSIRQFLLQKYRF